MTAPALSQQPAAWQCGNFHFTLNRPLIMGIINVTPDSFSDGGCYDTLESGYRHGMALLEAGADILDVGGESTRPRAEPVTEEEEKRRVLPLIEQLTKAGAAVSADTMKVPVMRAAIDSGACIINDVNGLRAAGAVEAVAHSSCGLVLMHMQGQPRTMQTAPHYRDVVREVRQFFSTQCAALAEAGVARARICVDPGIGFGKTASHNLALLNQLPALADDLPLLVGVSRKSLFAVLGGQAASERDIFSALAAVLLLERGANILRVHDVALTAQAVATWQLLSGETT